jgi:SAM-dependent methyltransferase
MFFRITVMRATHACFAASLPSIAMTLLKTSECSDPTAMWDRHFSRPDYLYGTTANAWLRSRHSLFSVGQTTLAVADGEGRNSVWLAQQGLAVDAFDISPVGVAKARELARAAGVAVQFHVSDCDAWPWTPAAYDHVVAIFVQFADPALRQRLFANMVRTLKPGGHLILQGFTPKQIEYNPNGPGLIDHLYTEALLRSSFAELDIIALRSYDAVIDEGRQPPGPSALIGLVARKR